VIVRGIWSVCEEIVTSHGVDKYHRYQLRHSIGKQEHVGKEHLSSYTISSVPCIPPAFRGVESLTLSHEVLEVVPLDIVREIADVDAAVLLRRFPDIVHGLFSLNRTILVRSLWSSAVCRTWSSTRGALAGHGGTASSAMATPRTVTG